MRKHSARETPDTVGDRKVHATLKEDTCHSGSSHGVVVGHFVWLNHADETTRVWDMSVCNP